MRRYKYYEMAAIRRIGFVITLFIIFILELKYMFQTLCKIFSWISYFLINLDFARSPVT